MERRYREVTLKRKKRSLRVLSGSVMLVIALKLLSGASGTWLEQLAEYGTNIMRPAVFKFQESYYKSKPTFLGMLSPGIFAYMEQSEGPKLVAEHTPQQDQNAEHLTESPRDMEHLPETSRDSQHVTDSDPNMDQGQISGTEQDNNSDTEQVSAQVSGTGHVNTEDSSSWQLDTESSGTESMDGLQKITVPVQLKIPQDTELALLQENIYNQREEGQETLLRPNELIDALRNVSDQGKAAQNSDLIQQYDLTQYYDMEQLIKDFYIVDASTSPDASLLNIEELTSFDCTIDKNAAGPQILIYHSHSQEGFADSVPGDKSTTIVGAGDRLTQLLEEEYGYDVLHHEGIYDLPNRDNAYSNALPDIEQVLEDNPTIQVVIDLHRDAVAEGKKLVTTIDGRDYARFMFFNGICRSTSGPITYLNNPYLQENLAFSFQAEQVAETYFPGITRKIYLKAWRYNMHFVPRNMLIELGAQTNTVEEIMNTTEILAFIIDKVLSGQ